MVKARGGDVPNLPFHPPPSVAPVRPAPPRPPQPPPPGLRAQVRRLPWFAISAVLHAALLALLAIIVVREPPRQDETAGVFQVAFYHGERENLEALPLEPPREPESEERQEEVLPIPLPKVPPPSPPVITNPPPQAPDSETTIKATPVHNVLGKGQPQRSLFAARSPEARARAVRQWGGTPASERAVDAGLEWLARHQEEETGRWSDGDPQLKLAPGLTALALLAFLGKGHSHTQPGPFRHNIQRAIAYLLSIQTPDGRFGEPYLRAGQKVNTYLMYHQAIATMALAEAYAVSADTALREPVRRAVAFIERAQQDAGGWDYGDLRTGRNDTSVTGWQLMALKSAHAAGFHVNWQTLFGGMRHLDLYTSPSGQIAYANRQPGAWRRGPAMTAVGLLSYQLLGWPRRAPLLIRMADALLREPPDWKKINRNDPRDLPTFLHTFYYWYYATLALFNMGGRWWEEWNPKVRDTLVAHQRLEGDRRGSWDPPEDGFDSVGGRTYCTALNVLTLEVYYRYLPFYRAETFEAIDILARAARIRGVPTTRRLALRLLANFPTREAEDILLAALSDHDRGVRAVARRSLVQQRSPRVIPTLLAMLGEADPLLRAQALAELASFRDLGHAEHLIRALADPECLVRERAATELRKLTGMNFGFRPDAPPAERQAAIAHWKAWHQAQSTHPPPEGIRCTVLVADPNQPETIVLGIGSRHAVRPGMRFAVRRNGRPIAVAQAVKVEPTLTVARILERLAEAVREGDIATSLPEPAVSEAGHDDTPPKR